MNVKQLTGVEDNHIAFSPFKQGLHKEVVEPWQALVDEAKLAGFELAIASSFRSFERQLAIWNRKMSGELILKDIDGNEVNIESLSQAKLIQTIMVFSALPGASRHHWGTEIDFYSPSLLSDDQSLQLESWEYQQSGPFAQLTTWLKNNAARFGFYFPYDTFRGGVAAEPWHLSYAPLSSQFTKQLNPKALSQAIENSELLGKDYLLSNIESIYKQYVINIGEFHHG